MAKRITWTETAWSDFEQVIEFIANDSTYYAAAFAGEIREAANSLRTFPERAPIVQEFNDKRIREIYIRKYRLIFQTRGDDV